MKPAEIRELSDEALAEKLKDCRAELFNLRFQMATSQLDNTARVSAVKKDIARVLTEQRARQIEAARIAMTRHMKRGGKVYITIFPDKPITKKPAETRMGSGKGNPEGWVAVVKPGRIMFEIAGVDDETAREALRLAINKLPIKCKIVTRETEGQE